MTGVATRSGAASPRAPLSIRTLLWHVVDAALEQPQPTLALQAALNALLEVTQSSHRALPE